MNECVANIWDSWNSYRTFVCEDHFPSINSDRNNSSSSAAQGILQERIEEVLSSIDGQMKEFENMIGRSTLQQRNTRALRDGVQSQTCNFHQGQMVYL